MAYAIIENEGKMVGNKPRVEIVMDGAADVSDLPTTFMPGSIAYAAAAGKPTYMLSPSGTWESLAPEEAES